MTKGPKQRLLRDLYNVSRTISQAKITPVLTGIWQMQGPVDEADFDFNGNMVPAQVDKEYISCSNSLKSGQRAEAGARDLCSFTCLHYMHTDQQLMGSKIDECSGDTCTGYASNVSVNDAAPNDRILKFETAQKSEMHNIESGNSSNTSENVYSEVCLTNCGSSMAFQDAALPKLEEPKGKDCLDDNVSYVTGAEVVKLPDANVISSFTIDLPSSAAYAGTLIHPGNENAFSHPASSACEDMKCNNGESRNNCVGQSKNSEESSDQMPVSICLPMDLSLQNSGLVAVTQNDVVDATCPLNVKDGSSDAPCVKSVQNEENSCSHFSVGLEVPSEHLDSLSTKEVTSDVVHNEMPIDAFQETDKVVGASTSHGAKGNSLESHPMDESEDSDMVEHDVKVCDICGDTGREDLLAICCRCSDGAEHTYCMREMLVKVPEGDWLCEECKFDVAIENQKQDKVSDADGNEKSSSGLTNPEKPNSSTKSEAKGSNKEGTRASRDPSGGKNSAKRHIEDAEVSSAAKKCILDPNVGSSKNPVSNGGVSFSRDSSFKHLDRGKIKPTQQSSFCTIVDPESADSPASGMRLHTPQGTLLKSTSFNSLNAKPKVKLVNDVFPQKQRSVREPISLNKREGASRQMAKSMSFKYTNSGLLNSSDSKLKMLSSKFPPVQDMKGSKYTKDRSFFERKNSFNAERTSVSSPMTTTSFAAKNDKKLASCGDSSLRNQRDAKLVQSDGKSVSLSRSSSFAVCKGSEMPVSLGEVKRLSSQLTSVVGVSSTDGTNSCDMKPKPSSPTEDSSSSSCIGERPPCYANEGVPDGLGRLKESTSFCERGKESSVCQSKQSSAIGRTDICQKCNESGHLEQFCIADRPASLVSDVSATRSSREITEGKDKLRAAIEAAVLRKPGIYRKQRVLDRPDDVSASSISSEVAPQHRVLNSSSRGNTAVVEEMSEGQMMRENCVADSCKQVTDDSVKQPGMLHVGVSTSRAGDACHAITSEGSSLIRDKQGQVPATISTLLKTLPIPDHEYIWQGNFEVYRKGHILKFYDGIQAHLSNCVSNIVRQAVNKFPLKVLLNELPRLSTWPGQFQEYGVKEENIALYFYPKDLLSYEKSYKELLDNMMKNDLALQGNLDDVELMIFPSNQLPEKSQRWNKLFFLWGVFRGRRVGCSKLSSQNQMYFPQNIPSAITSSLKNIRPLDKDLPECGESASVSDVPASREFPCLSASQALDGDCDIRVASQVPSDNHMQTGVQKQDHGVYSSSVVVVESRNPESHEERNSSIPCQEMQCTSTSLEGSVKCIGKLERGGHASGEASSRTAAFDRCEQMPKDEDSSLSGRGSWYQIDKRRADGHGSLGGGNIIDKMSTCRYQVDLEDGSMLVSRPPGTIDPIVKANSKHNHAETVERMLEAAAAVSSSLVIPGNDADDKSMAEAHSSKRQKTDLYDMYGGSNQTSSPVKGFVSGIHNASSRSLPQADCQAKGSDGTAVLTSKGNSERYFFPIGRHAEEIDVNRAAQSIPWKSNSLEEDRVHDKTPNLELALGAETKPLLQGVPAFLVGKEEKRITRDHCSREGATNTDDDEESASLSLSLSFPFPDEEQRVRFMSDTEQQHVNTWLLFGGSRDK